MEKHDKDVVQVLRDDGVNKVVIGDLENMPTTSIDDLIKKMGSGSWAARLVYNDRFGGVVIQQQPGEGNRLHYHPDADECWVILEGEYKWSIDGEEQEVSVGDIVVVKEKTWHQITVIGDKPAARLAITKPDVDHIYEDWFQK